MPRKPKTASVPSTTTNPSLQQTMLTRDHVGKSDDPLRAQRELVRHFHDSEGILVKIRPNEGNPPGKLADVELHFCIGLLRDLKLFGFAVWTRLSRPGDLNVTFPARQYSVNGERRSFALLRPSADRIDGQERVRDLIIAAYRIHEAEQKAEAANAGA